MTTRPNDRFLIGCGSAPNSAPLSRLRRPVENVLTAFEIRYDFNFGYGIGAVGYFRRVLENKINALLDLISEAARNEGVGSEHLDQIEATKQSHRLEDKIQLASKILPAHLRPGGHNPLDKLYAPLSAGLHGESDDECLTIFAEAKFVFEYLFKNLTVGNEEARKYAQELSTSGQPKSRPKADA